MDKIREQCVGTTNKVCYREGDRYTVTGGIASLDTVLCEDCCSGIGLAHPNWQFKWQF